MEKKDIKDKKIINFIIRIFWIFIIGSVFGFFAEMIYTLVYTRILSEIASVLIRIDKAKKESEDDESFSSLRNKILEMLNSEEVKFVIDNAKKIDEFKKHKAFNYMLKLIAKDFNNII